MDIHHPINENSIESFKEFLGQPTPEILYHYTNLTGLFGILNSEEIWFSDLYFLNDKSEFELGLGFVIDCLTEIKNLVSEKPLIAKFVEVLEEAINFIKDRSAPFILSLTENQDLLSQWRGYTENGVGVNLGLATSFFKENDIRIYKCIYNPKLQREFAKAIILKAIATFENKLEQFASHYDSEETFHMEAVSVAAGYFIDNTIFACSLIKDFGFTEEQEWRAIFINRSQKVYFLPTRSFYKPYVKIKFGDFNKNLISITAGPNPDRELCHLSIQKLLTSKDISKTYIDFSIIPYRN